jgi:transcriptional regulator with XRE-family HTH domain
MPRRVFDTLDHIIGANIRKRRLALGITQAELGASLSISFQQIQKYERAKNRVAASTLVRMAIALKCRLEDFLSLD